MKYARILIFLATLTLALAGTGGAKADLIQPTDARGIRQFPGHDPFLLNFLSIQHGAEDRTVLEFDLSALAGPVSSAILDVPLRNLDPGRNGVIDLFTFPGSGIVTPNLFGAGTFFSNFVNNQTGVEHIDVTAAVLAAQEEGDHFLGFRLSSTSDTRWLLGQIAGLPNPTLNAEVIPEPSTLVLWGIGGLGLFGYWRRRNLRKQCQGTPFCPHVEGLEERCVLATVTNLNDSGMGSLRQAIIDTLSGGTVDFQAGLTGTIALSTGELMIAKDLTITGPGDSVITVSGNHASRVFEVSGRATVTISGLTITDGQTTNFTGGSGMLVDSGGTLTLTGCTISDNTANFDGAGILNNGGTLTLTGCTISDNSVNGNGIGGGIANRIGVLMMANCTISGNSAAGNFGDGGGIMNFETLTLTDCTISGNMAEGGGGIYNHAYGGLATATVSNCTVSGNSAIGSQGAGGIANISELSFNATVQLINCTLSVNTSNQLFSDVLSGTGSADIQFRNSIIAGDGSGPDLFSLDGGTFTSGGHNLVRDGTGGSGFADTDLVGTDAFPIDPMLEPLGDYGGPTQTMRPLPGSPVINTGDNTDAPDTDQRGFPRIVLGFIDIGAVELQPDEFGPRSRETLVVAFVTPMAGSWGSVVEAPVSPVARQEVIKPLKYLDTTVRRAKDLVFGESHRAQRLVPTNEWESNESFV